MNIPSIDRLHSDLGRTYLLGAGQWETPVPAQLKAVKRGVPMNAQYSCYSALLALPQNVDLPQVSCSVSSGDTVWPLLLLTPVQRDNDGRPLMQMVFHTLISQEPQASFSGT